MKLRQGTIAADVEVTSVEHPELVKSLCLKSRGQNIMYIKAWRALSTAVNSFVIISTFSIHSTFICFQILLNIKLTVII